MKFNHVNLCLIVLIGLSTAAHAAPKRKISLFTSQMTPIQFRQSGLQKLNSEELNNLNLWLGAVLSAVMRTDSSSQTNSGEAEISTAVNDETFVIDKAVFKAKTYCFGVNEGDRVRFIEGSASGACASAKFLVLSTGNICEVWCE